LSPLKSGEKWQQESLDEGSHAAELVSKILSARTQLYSGQKHKGVRKALEDAAEADNRDEAIEHLRNARRKAAGHPDLKNVVRMLDVFFKREGEKYVRMMDSFDERDEQRRPFVEGKDTALKMGIKNPNSSGQGHHADHAKNPFHGRLEKAGLKYSHTTPVGDYGRDTFTLHHTYRLNRNFAVSVWKSAKDGQFRWEGGKSGSGRRRSGLTGADLAKYLRSAVKRHSTKESIDEGKGATNWTARIAKGATKHRKRIGERWYKRIRDLLRDDEHDDALNVLSGAFGMNALPGDVAKLVKDFDRLNEAEELGESMRVSKYFYVVDKGTGKVVSRGFPRVDDADAFFEKDKNFAHKTHQVISGWALSDQAFKN
jgi:hypothetical protein